MTPKSDPRIDEYIAGAPERQQPILNHLRSLIHELVPEVEETIKWSNPFFDYKGHFVALYSLKDSVSIRFARGGEIPEVKEGLGSGPAGQINKVRSLADLPEPETLKSIILQAKYLNESVPWPVYETIEREIPDDLMAALESNPPALEIWTNWTTAKRKDYIVWVTEAKKPETRQQRISTAIEWIAENKVRNWQSIEKMKAKGTR